MLAALAILISLEFSTLVHDFGKVEHLSDELSCYFEVKNTSEKAISILEVMVDCDCTKAVWPEDAIEPGESARIFVTYHKEPYADSFSKGLTVYVSDKDEPYSLQIKGSFYESAATLEPKYPVRYGQFGFGSAIITIGNIAPCDTADFQIDCANLGQEDATLSFSNLPDGVSLSNPEITLAPLTKGTISGRLICDNTKWGKQNFKLGPVAISAFIVEDFSHATKEQQLHGPYPRLQTNRVSFNDIKPGTSKQVTVDFENYGEEPLVIRSCDIDSDLVTANYPATTPANGKGHITFTLSVPASATCGYKSFEATITTNSPLKPLFTLYIDANIL